MADTPRVGHRFLNRMRVNSTISRGLSVINENLEIFPFPTGIRFIEIRTIMRSNALAFNVYSIIHLPIYPEFCVRIRIASHIT